MKNVLFLIWLLAGIVKAQEGIIMTVNGPIPSSQMGTSLIHEHVLVNFTGIDETDQPSWNIDEVISVVQPFLEQANNLGVKTLVECTPAYLGRVPLLLKALSNASGMHLVTNTGYYGASDNKFLPEHARTETAGQLSARWTKEWEEGIDDSGVRPGFIKIGVNDGILSSLHVKLTTAAALTHLQTGLVIASHTGSAVPALEQIALLEKEGVAAEAFIWVHAQTENNLDYHIQAARKGTWISLDGLNESNLEDYLKKVKNLKEHGLLNKTLISHDAGWYSPGEINGGEFRGYHVLFEEFVPLLLKKGFSKQEIEQLLVVNPQKAFEIRKRTADQ